MGQLGLGNCCLGKLARWCLCAEEIPNIFRGVILGWESTPLYLGFKAKPDLSLSKLTGYGCLLLFSTQHCAAPCWNQRYTQSSLVYLVTVSFMKRTFRKYLIISSFYPLGIVPSSVVLTGFQVMSRVFLTWAVTHSVREVWTLYYSFQMSIEYTVQFIGPITPLSNCYFSNHGLSNADVIGSFSFFLIVRFNISVVLIHFYNKLYT